MRRRTILGWLLVLATPGATAAPEGIHLGAGPGPGSIAVRWVAEAGDDGAWVDVGRREELDRSVSASLRDVPGAPWDAFEGVVTDLEAGQMYHYRVRQGENTTTVRTFKTLPAQGKEFRVAVWGDQGTPDLPQTLGEAPRDVAQLVASLSADADLLVGDIAYGTGSAKDWLAFLRQAEAHAARRPLLTVPGNHEGDDGFVHYDALFASAGPVEVADVGSARIVLVDSTRFCLHPERTEADAPEKDGECTFGVDEELVRALDRTLAEARDEGAQWVIVAHHHPVWSHSRHGSSEALQSSWAPLYETHDVDLVLTAHDHAYLRTHPLIDGTVVSEGPVYVVVGTGGALPYNFTGEPAWVAAAHRAIFGVLVLEGSHERLQAEFVTTDGRRLDAFQLVPRRDPKAEAPLAAWLAPLALLIAAVRAASLRSASSGPGARAAAGR